MKRKVQIAAKKMAADNLMDECPRTGEVYPCSVPIPRAGGAWRIIGGRIDAGAHGAIYFVVDPDGNHKILKLYTNSHGPKAISQEVCFQNLAATQGIAPKVYDYWRCKGREGYGAMVMERAGNTTLKSFLEMQRENDGSLSPENIKSLFQVLRAFVWLWIQTMKLNVDVKMIHFDLHLDNVMVNVDANTNVVTNVQLIDFGTSQMLSHVIQQEITPLLEAAAAKSDILYCNKLQEGVKLIYNDRSLPLEFFEDTINARREDGTDYFTSPFTRKVFKFIFRVMSEIELNKGLKYIRFKEWYPINGGSKMPLAEMIDTELDALKGEIDEFFEKNIQDIDGWDFGEALFAGLH